MNIPVNEVQKYLKGADYPMDGTQLSELAERNGGPRELVEVLRGVSTVDGPNGVMKQIREHLGGRSG
jgi:bifunctional ADP-heptose synthase (sugar kinase/adenylyltransferase)